MVKQMISFTGPQHAFLVRTAKRLGISLAELVRRIIDSHITRVGLLVVALILAGCGSSPTSPESPAALESRGEITIVCGESVCQFTGIVTNIGIGCATDSAGTTSFRVIGRAEPAALIPVEMPSAVLRPGESVEYRGSIEKKAIMALLPSQWFTTTVFRWRDTRC